MYEEDEETNIFLIPFGFKQERSLKNQKQVRKDDIQVLNNIKKLGHVSII